MNETAAEPVAPETEEPEAPAAEEKAAGVKLPRFRMPDVSIDRRLRMAAGISALVAAVLILAGMGAYRLYKGITAPLPDAGLLVSSIKAQQQVLSAQKKSLDGEQERFRKEREEYVQYLNELHQVEDRLEDLLVSKQAGEDRLASQRKEDEARRLREQAEAQRLAAEQARADSLTQMTNIRKMSKIYNGMRPAALAVILPQLREDLALQILLRMDERRVGRLFAALDPKYAARLSMKLNEAQKTDN